MFKKSLVAMVLVSLIVMATTPMMVKPAKAMMPLDCEEMLNGGGQGRALGCIDMVIAMYEGAGPWDGTWESGGHGTWPPY